ncbi:hypothetical protein BDV35DRAFT_388020 [Aspergillus flavus]|uniref:Uncharacterized protein n=1 Tax=Aspergillus flavus TaxID=5059 RepID=A0A5N6HB34_ASPFL|nr:hypothetical protein BDV35DRAFT_388020 [Aspergillus flavus]
MAIGYAEAIKRATVTPAQIRWREIERWKMALCATIYPHVLKGISALVSDSKSLRGYQYQRGRGRTKHFDGFFETARGICESSAHPDRDSLLADIYFCLGSIAMDTNDFNGSRIFKELSLDLVSSICNELGTVGERLYLAYEE